MWSKEVRFCWQAQHFVPSGVGVGESVLGAVSGWCGIGVLHLIALLALALLALALLVRVVAVLVRIGISGAS